MGFKDVSIDIDTNLQVVAGPNNAGKSTLVRALEVFFSRPSKTDMLSVLPLNDYYLQEGARTLTAITVHFGQLSDEELKVFSSAIRKRDGSFSVTLRSSRTGRVSFEASLRPGSEEAERLYREVLDRFLFVNIPSVRTAGGSLSESDSMERLMETLEATLIRSGASRSTSLQQDFSKSIAPVEQLIQKVLNASASAIEGDMPFQDGTVQFKLPSSRHALRGMLRGAVVESVGSVTLPVSERGTGFQSALVLGVLKFVAESEAQAGGNALFAIEEPEAFLHPQTQRGLASVLSQVAERNQLLITTHSSVLVDSFPVDQIARMPLMPTGLTLEWTRPTLTAAETGRLSRYCSAANSELIFASAVIFVEGESDWSVLEYLLGRSCGGAGGHYARGVTVIQAAGISKIEPLIELAQHFGVRSYLLADRDGTHNKGGKRELLHAIKRRTSPPAAEQLDELIREADVESKTLKEAINRQTVLNATLTKFDAFVLSSDLEGLILDCYGVEALVRALGPAGAGEINATFARELLDEPGGEAKLRSWLGSWGWNSKSRPSGKLAAHLPVALIRDLLEKGDEPEALQPLQAWLDDILEAAKPPTI